MTDLSKQTPVQIDTEIARIGGLIASQQAGLANCKAQLGRLDEGRRVFESRERIETRIEKHIAAIAALKEEAAPYLGEYTSRGGWSRYYLCTAAGGHVHSSTHCSTCFSTTTYSWLVEFSARTSAELIEIYGEDMCSECYPEAPVLARGYRKSVADADAARQEREAKRAAKRAEQIEVIKANGRTEIFKTRRSIENEISRCIYNVVTWEGGSKLDEDRAEALAEALAKKVGENPDEILAASKAKQIKKRVSELRRTIKRFNAGDWGMLNQPSFTAEDRAEALAKAEASLAHFEALAA
jgi:hypothetical protein